MLIIEADTRVPIYKPLKKWQKYLPSWLVVREYLFISDGKRVRCHPFAFREVYRHLCGR